MNLYRFIQTVLKDQRLKRPGLWWQSQGNKKLVEISKRSSNKLGVYTVEMMAIFGWKIWVENSTHCPLQWVEKVGQEKVLICSDSLSVLASLRSFHSKAQQDILYEVLQVNTRLSHVGCQVKFMWAPAHVGITGNEMADRLAKRALTKENVEVQVNVSKAEVKCIIWEKIEVG